MSLHDRGPPLTDIFLSYSHQDRDVARRYADALQAAGLAVWWDDHLRSGEAFDEKIEAALRAAKAVVVLWSKTSVTSRWVRAEATLADRNKTLVPVMIEPCERPIMFELTQTVDLTHWLGAADDPAWLAFLDDVQRMAGEISNNVPVKASEHVIPHGLSVPTTRSDAILIAVMPFETTSGDPMDASLAKGLSIEVGNALGQVGRLRAISSAAFDPASRVDLRKLASEWGAQYAITGALVRQGTQFRILAQLVSVENGAQIWSATYSENDADLFEIQKQIAESIVRQIGGEVIQSEYARINRGGPSSANAWALTAHSAHIIIERRGGANAWNDAIEIVEGAIALAPEYGAAYARLSALCAERIIALASPDILADQARAVSAADQAIELAGNDPYALMNAAQGMSLCGDAARAGRILKRSVVALPHDLLAWTFYWSHFSVFLAESELPELIETIERTQSQHPSHPLAAVLGGSVAICWFRLGQLDRAKTILEDAFDDAPGFPHLGMMLAAIYAVEGNEPLALQILDKLTSRGFNTSRSYMRQLADVTSLRDFAAALVPLCEQ